jgi:hypothetical protein
MSLRNATEANLRDAMKRLLDGAPTRSAGGLTISGWAKEAGVHRSTPYRSPELLAEFIRRVAETGERGGTDIDRLGDQLKMMEREIHHLRHERSERERSLEAHNRALANQLNAAMVELERLRRQDASRRRGRLIEDVAARHR